MRVLVLGAGIIGVAIAEALAAGGAEVIVIDMRSAGRGASQASAGILAPFTEAHRGGPLLALGDRSLKLYDEFVRRIREHSGRSVPYARTGTLEVALDDSHLSRLQSVRTWLDAEGVPHTWLDPDALWSFERAVTDAARGALFVPQHGFVDVRALVDAVVQAARWAGARFEPTVEVGAVVAEGESVRVRTDRGDYEADAVVLAAGAWTGRIQVSGRPALPVQPIRGQLLHLRWPGSLPPARVIWGEHCYVVPWQDGSVLVGATVEDVGFDEASSVAGVMALMQAATALLPELPRAAVEAIRVGLRPATPDGLPFVGPLGGAPRVIAATGHYRNGILLAPLTAALVADHLLRGETDPMLEVTSPTRLAG